MNINLLNISYFKIRFFLYNINQFYFLRFFVYKFKFIVVLRFGREENSFGRRVRSYQNTFIGVKKVGILNYGLVFLTEFKKEGGFMFVCSYFCFEYVHRILRQL